MKIRALFSFAFSAALLSCAAGADVRTEDRVQVRVEPAAELGAETATEYGVTRESLVIGFPSDNGFARIELRHEDPLVFAVEELLCDDRGCEEYGGPHVHAPPLELAERAESRVNSESLDDAESMFLLASKMRLTENTENPALDDRIRLGLGTICYRKQLWQSALRFFRQIEDPEMKKLSTNMVREIRTDVFGVLRHQAEQSFDAGEFHLALTSASDALSINASDASLHVLRGRALYELAQKEEALESFELAIRISPSTTAYFYKACIFIESGKQDEALACLSSPIPAGSSESALVDTLAKIVALTRQPDAEGFIALRDAQKSSRTPRESLDLVKRHLSEKTLDEIRRVILSFSGDPETLAKLKSFFHEVENSKESALLLADSMHASEDFEGELRILLSLIDESKEQPFLVLRAVRVTVLCGRIEEAKRLAIKHSDALRVNCLYDVRADPLLSEIASLPEFQD
ncbi:MAG: hypothetical protein NUW37_19565 [Planctomycetes bacterium]|nr:hypothetical protein [Planctomycetota bacterium]